MVRARRLTVAVALVFAAATPSRAEHPDVVAAHTSPIAGGLAPLAGADHVRLLGAAARITIDADGSGYAFSATYRVENPGPAPARVVVGVPLLGITKEIDDEGEDPFTIWAEGVTDLPRRLDLRVGATPLHCGLSVKTDLPWPDPMPARWPADRAPPAPLDGGYCVAEVEVGAGARVALGLVFHAPLAYEDVRSEQDGSTFFGTRTLALAPFPGSWPFDPAAQLSLRVEPGRFADSIAPPPGSPSPLRWDGGIGTWTGTAREASLAALDLRLDPALLRAAELAACPRPAGVFHARASSTLRAQGGRDYVPENMLDADVGTAWCEGQAGGGDGAWIEVDAVLTGEPEGFSGWVITPGYARTQRTWELNRRVRTLRVGPCDGTEEGTIVTLDDRVLVAVDARADRGTVVLPPLQGPDPVGSLLGAKRGWPHTAPREACTRFTLLDTVGGPVPDACISTLRPIRRCDQR